MPPNNPLLDPDGYPLDIDLMAIEKASITDLADVPPLVEFVRARWAYPDYWRVAPRRRRGYKGGPLYRQHLVSTGGWSGNESLISAMEHNFLLWHFVYHSHRVGGHYEFRVQE